MSNITKEATAAPSTIAGLLRRIATAIGAWQENVSDRAHASGDVRACAQGWTVTRSAGRFGFGARAYRDPRMNSLAARGNAPHNGVQITHLDTVTARGGA